MVGKMGEIDRLFPERPSAETRVKRLTEQNEMYQKRLNAEVQAHKVTFALLQEVIKLLEGNTFDGPTLTVGMLDKFKAHKM